ncbi:hypothetical protein LCGC14_2621910, partial [marine sediment metagenome]
REVMEAHSIDVAAKRTTMLSAQRQAALKSLAEAVEQRKDQWKEKTTGEGLSVLDWVQGGLDVAGLTPGVGIFPDAANTVVSVFRGRWFDAGANALAMIPILGQGTKGAQLAYKGGKLARAGDKLEDAASLGRVGRAATQSHHMATFYGKWGDKFKDLFKRANLDPKTAVTNIMDLPGHSGRHTNKYHAWVYRILRTAVGNKRGKAAKDALEDALSQIKKRVEENPRLPYKDGGL